MRPWFERDPARLVREHREVKERYPGSVLFRKGGLLAWLVKMRVEGDDYVVVATYPAAFPHERIDVVPVSPAWRKLSHQASDGRLCLLTYVPNRWDPSYGAAFMLDRAKGWIELQLGISKPEHLGEVPFWEGEYLHATYVSEEALPFMRGHGCGEFYAIPWTDRQIYLVTRLTSFDGADIAVGPPEKFLEAMGAPRSPEFKGLWFAADDEPPWIHRPENLDDLGTFIEAHSTCPKGVGRLRRYIEKHQGTKDLASLVPMMAVNPNPGGGTQSVGFAFTVFKDEANEWVYPSALVPVDYGREVVSRNSGVVDLEALAKKTITVVGLGAVGSVVAVALAKAGAKRFRLFDHQRIEPGNVARHACDLRDVGRKKVDAVGDLIVRRNPEASVTVHDVNVLSEGGIAELSRALEESDIVVVATGDRESAGLVNRLSLDTGVRAVYASVLAGARGGEVFRVTPYETPCYQCIQRYKANDPRWKAVAEYDERTRPEESPGDGCGDVFAPGTAIDTDTVALAQARLTLQTLLRGEPGSSYRDEVCDYLLVGNARGEPFRGSHHVIKDDSYRRRVQDCEQCGKVQRPLDEDEQRLYGRLLEEAKEL